MGSRFWALAHRVTSGLLQGWAELGMGKVREHRGQRPGLAPQHRPPGCAERAARVQPFRGADPCPACPSLPPGLWLGYCRYRRTVVVQEQACHSVEAWLSPISRATQPPMAPLGARPAQPRGGWLHVPPTQSPRGHGRLQGRGSRSLPVGCRLESVLKGQGAALWSLQQAP